MNPIQARAEERNGTLYISVEGFATLTEYRSYTRALIRALRDQCKQLKLESGEQHFTQSLISFRHARYFHNGPQRVMPHP